MSWHKRRELSRPGFRSLSSQRKPRGAVDEPRLRGRVDWRLKYGRGHGPSRRRAVGEAGVLP